MQGKVDRQPAYVLHTQPYRETSLLVEVLTRDYGRFTLVARGARRPRSDLRGLLLPFQPLQLAWFGKGELRTLHTVDWRGGVPQFAGQRLLTGYYLNELLLRLAPRDDPSAELFSLYDKTVRTLAKSEQLPAVLRGFELSLLRQLGYAPELLRDVDGRDIDADADYWCAYAQPARRLPFSSADAEPGLILNGQSLLAMAAGDFEQSAVVRRDARQFCRLWLDELLGRQPLASRELLATLLAIAE